ncbi:MAG: epoxyqueuosine reductase QueH [Parasporobacterium sp.]|nr:epoxyqueuosine reductase QueH [Parasporobacterium sp.]
MAVVNYQLELDRIIQMEQAEGRTPTLLLHSCCGPCSSYVVTYLQSYFKVTVLYYNPNISPEEEYDHRLSEQARLLEALHVPLLTLPYEHGEFLTRVSGLEGEPEGGRRCEECFRLRLEKTFELAVQEHFDYFCTTLTVSPHKNASVINRVGMMIQKTEAEEKDAAVMWLPSDFKKREGYKQSIELSKKFGLYRQTYCGCEFA